MPKRLTRLRISEVSSVDNGAGEGVRVMLMKRYQVPLDKAEKAEVAKYLGRNLFAEAEAKAKTEKRDFSAKDRRRLAGTGAALPDGSFPIANEGDLKNAIRAVGRASDPGRARAHIMSRARSMGLTSLIPDNWKSTKKSVRKRFRERMAKFVKSLNLEKALDFNAAQANTEASEYADGMMCEIREAVCSLQASICSIMCDDDIVDKQAAVEATLRQFQDHLGGVVPEGIEQALQAAQLIAEGAKVNPQGAVVGKRKDREMAIDTLEKAKAKMGDMADKMAGQKERRKAAEKRLAEIETELATAKTSTSTAEAALTVANKRIMAVLKLSPEHRDWLNHPDNLMGDEERLAFLDMPLAKRDEVVAATPVEKLTEKRVASLPASVREEFLEGREYRKNQAERDKADQLVTMTKRATEIGLPEAFGKHFVAFEKADPDGFKVLHQFLKGLDEQQRTSVVFKEFGSNRDGDTGSAVALIKVRAAELMKADPKIATEEQAIMKIADSRNSDDQKLWQAYKAETAPPGIRAVA